MNDWDASMSLPAPLREYSKLGFYISYSVISENLINSHDFWQSLKTSISTDSVFCFCAYISSFFFVLFQLMQKMWPFSGFPEKSTHTQWYSVNFLYTIPPLFSFFSALHFFTNFHLFSSQVCPGDLFFFLLLCRKNKFS